MTLRLRIRAFWWAIGMRLWTRLWWSLTQHFSRIKNTPLPKFDAGRDIAAYLNYGNSYVPDKPHFDAMYHATHSEVHLLTGNHASMDCDDHAAYWAQALLRSGLAKKVWIGDFRMVDDKGHTEGHALCVFRDSDGKRYWADYANPRDFDGDWDWAEQSAQTFGKKLICAGLIEVAGVTPDGRIKFGRVRIM